jgi:formylglycine-generating enzyme
VVEPARLQRISIWISVRIQRKTELVMRRLTYDAAGVGVLLAVACGPSELPPAGEIVLHAPLPKAWSETVTGYAWDEPAPLFDRVRFDVHRWNDLGSCTGCTRTFDVDRRSMDGPGVSMSVMPGDTGAIVRVRLFSSALQRGEVPHPDGTLEAWVGLPPVSEGRLHRWILLPTDAVARPIGTFEEPMSPEAGEAPAGLVGTWPHAERTGCIEPPRDGEVCVPGGAFWMGNPRAEGFLVSGVAAPRLVVISSFYLEQTEVSVGAFRAAKLATAFDPGTDDGIATGEEMSDWCTFTSQPDASESLPVNCMSWAIARAYCTSRGGDLPTEAQLEYVAGALQSGLYVWGIDEPSCNDAIFARGPAWGTIIPSNCNLGDGIGGPLPVDRGDYARDVVELSSGGIFDIAGNLGELARDGYSDYESSCWQSGVVFDPECPSDGASDRTVKSGGWASEGELLRAASRKRIPAHTRGIDIGFRCARSNPPPHR